MYCSFDVAPAVGPFTHPRQACLTHLTAFRLSNVPKFGTSQRSMTKAKLEAAGSSRSFLCHHMFLWFWVFVCIYYYPKPTAYEPLGLISTFCLPDMPSSALPLKVPSTPAKNGENDKEKTPIPPSKQISIAKSGTLVPGDISSPHELTAFVRIMLCRAQYRS